MMKNREMKGTMKGLMKKGLVFGMIGVMAFSMMACSGPKKKNAGTNSQKSCNFF